MHRAVTLGMVLGAMQAMRKSKSVTLVSLSSSQSFYRVSYTGIESYDSALSSFYDALLASIFCFVIDTPVI